MHGGYKDFFTQTELIEPVSHQAAQLGIHFFHNTQLEKHLLLRNLIKDTVLVKESRNRWMKKKSPAPGRISNLQPQEFCSAGLCSTSVLQPQPYVSI